MHLNSIGCPECRKAYHEKLKAYLAPKLSGLCKTCQERYERNPLRILDCKEDAQKLSDAPAMLERITKEDCEGFIRENLAPEKLAMSIIEPERS